MNKYLAAATTALTLSVAALATPAFADHNTPVPGYGGNAPKASQSNDNNDFGRGDNGRGARGGASYNFDQNDERGFDGWERGWKRGGFGEYGHQGVLSYRKLVRRLERQGYYDVRGLRQSQWGFGMRAFAFNGRGYPVMLRINPYTGLVLEARPVGRRHFGHRGW
ncbi:MAG: hypothetical protein ABL996_11905 [Micropepsaceae bacterium]